jgi:DNA-binding response OmpR family regulator
MIKNSTKPVILIVDDDVQIRELLTKRFADSGFAVESASVAEVASSMINIEKLEVILTDIQFPGMNGLELTKILRSRGVEIPIFVMTGLDDITDEDAFNAGATALLNKPFDIEELIELVKLSISEEVLGIDG